MAGKVYKKFGLSTLNNYFRAFSGNNIYMPCDAFMDKMLIAGWSEAEIPIHWGYWMLEFTNKSINV
jgi:hypothetical protein